MFAVGDSVVVMMGDWETPDWTVATVAATQPFGKFEVVWGMADAAESTVVDIARIRTISQIKL